MTYDVRDVAKYIVSYYTKNSAPISHLQLQKILYFLWISFYKETRRFLFEEPMVAWPLGPVSTSVYHEFCTYGAGLIEEAYNVSLEPDQQVIDASLEKFKGETAFNLVKNSHRLGGAWREVYQRGSGRGCEIDFELIINREC